MKYQPQLRYSEQQYRNDRSKLKSLNRQSAATEALTDLLLALILIGLLPFAVLVAFAVAS